MSNGLGAVFSVLLGAVFSVSLGAFLGLKLNSLDLGTVNLGPVSISCDGNSFMLES